MRMTAAELRGRLGQIEPSPRMYEGFEASDVAPLVELLRDDEPWMAARAVHALLRIDVPAAHDALLKALGDERPEVRVALASGAPSAPAAIADTLVATLLGDANVGVRKFAIRAVGASSGPAVRERLEAALRAEPDAALKALASERLRAASASHDNKSSD